MVEKIFRRDEISLDVGCLFWLRKRRKKRDGGGEREAARIVHF